MTPGIDLLRKAVRYSMRHEKADERLKLFAEGKEDLSHEELRQLSQRLFGGMFDFDGDALRPVLTKMPAGMFPDPPRPNRFILKRRLRVESAKTQMKRLRAELQLSDSL